MESKLSKVTQGLFLIVLLLALLILLKSFLVPFAYGLLIALIIYPVCKRLEQKMPQSVAVLLALLLVVLAFGSVVYVFIYQLLIVNRELPGLISQLRNSLPFAQEWIDRTFGMSVDQQTGFINDLGKSFTSNLGSFISGSVTFATEAVFYIVIIPLYAALILLYRKKLVEFAGSMMGSNYKKDLPAILSETIHMYFNYIKGMIGVYLTVGVLNSIGLLLIGVDYAILFGMVTAFMTIIPYVGIIISSILPIAMVWAETNNIWYPVGVVAIFSFVQYLEANLIFPYIVGKQIGINTLASIIAIFFGAAIWGFSGVMLFLPFMAIIKIISGHIESLKPLGSFLEMSLKPGKKPSHNA